jgi:enamine deaminase RidA (YjgF/YER057c/UK114 family)
MPAVALGLAGIGLGRQRQVVEHRDRIEQGWNPGQLSSQRDQLSMNQRDHSIQTIRYSKPAGSTIQEQTRQAVRNCESTLKAAGASLDDVVDVLVLLARPDDFAGLNEEYAKLFLKDPPARAVSRFGVELPGILVSIKMTAVAPH